jgi:cobalt/nickel transport system ATP-binding protein
VTVSGLRVAKATIPEVRRRVGIVLQDPDDQLFMGSVRADVAFGPANLGLRGPALVVADGSTYDVLTDEELMRAHRLELPFGFEPRSASPRS